MSKTKEFTFDHSLVLNTLVFDQKYWIKSLLSQGSCKVCYLAKDTDKAINV
jgi:hypothetical protein